MLPTLHSLLEALESNQLSPIRDSETMGGAHDAQHFRVSLEDGSELFVKTWNGAPEGFFNGEAQGLKALAEHHNGDSTCTKTARVLLHGDNFIATHWEAESRKADNFYEKLAEMLAGQHSTATPAFGFHCDTFCGPTLQRNPQTDDGYAFFAEYRLLALAAPVYDQGLLPRHSLKQLESICSRLPDFIPQQKPVLLHGDLWTGNCLSGATGQPVLIDPACYWGWAEADLAMTSMFGVFPEHFYQHYAVLAKPEAGWQQRFNIYNLYHLLNHTLLFGEAYALQLQQSLKQLH